VNDWDCKLKIKHSGAGLSNVDVYGVCFYLNFQILIAIETVEQEVDFINVFIDMPFWQFLISK